MLDATDLRFFAVIAAARSLAAAARDLNVTPPAVTQRLQALEARLGIHLIDRKGRQLTLSDEGELLAERGRLLLAGFADLDEALAERRGDVVGHLRVVAPFGFGRRYVAPVAAAFQESYPEVRMDLQLSDRLGKVPADMWDIAIHVGETRYLTPSLNIRKLAPNNRIACASPAYLARAGYPTTPSDLLRHVCIALRENDDDVTFWRFRDSGRVQSSIRIRPRLTSNDGEVVRGWAVAGRGIIIRSEWDVADDLRTRRLLPILVEYGLPPAPVVALLGSRKEARTARSTRFLAALAHSLRPVPWRFLRPEA